MKRIVVINGHNQTGKDTFIDFISKHKNSETNLTNISTVDVIKEAAALLGWDGEKNEAGRLALHELKMLAYKHFDHSFQYVAKTAKMLEDDAIMFVHCREPQEIERFVKDLSSENTRVLTLLLLRDTHTVANNDADKNVSKFKYDFTIENNGTLDELESKACSYLVKHIYNDNPLAATLLNINLAITHGIPSALKNIAKKIGIRK